MDTSYMSQGPGGENGQMSLYGAWLGLVKKVWVEKWKKNLLPKSGWSNHITIGKLTPT